MKIKQFVITKDGPQLLGATDRHPYGRADASDEGELRIALAADHSNGIVRLQFGTPVAWIGLPANQARDLAAMLGSGLVSICTFCLLAQVGLTYA